MGPSWTNIYVIDDGTGTCQGTAYDTNVTFYPTYPNEAISQEQQDAAMKEIERLEDMMHARSGHDDGKHMLQHREVKHAKRAKVKHKRPHMNRKVMR